VTINVLATIKRELELRDENAARERLRLVGMLGHEGDGKSLNEELCARIREGAIAVDDAALREHVRESIREALSINNPRWLRG
jgi:ABC-type transport system involved in Fe-S cluster assembly fused permease/ATPase subunit